MKTYTMDYIDGRKVGDRITTVKNIIVDKGDSRELRNELKILETILACSGSVDVRTDTSRF